MIDPPRRPDLHAARPSSRFRSRHVAVDEPIFGLASDVAANIFVVLFLALAVALSVRQAPRVAETYDLTSSPRLIERAPLSPAELVAALFRRQAMASTAIDLLQDRVRVVTEGQVREWTWDRAGDSLGALNAASGDTGAIDLFVFDPHGYAFLQRALRGHRLIELSVPAALRACSSPAPEENGCTPGYDWSDDFRHLFGIRMTGSDFRAALAKLLSARAETDKSERHGADRGFDTQPRSASVDQPTQPVSERPGFIWLALFAGSLAVIELIARRKPSGRRGGG